MTEKMKSFAGHQGKPLSVPGGRGPCVWCANSRASLEYNF